MISLKMGASVVKFVIYTNLGRGKQKIYNNNLRNSQETFMAKYRLFHKL